MARPPGYVLRIEPGEMVATIGRNGVGKSTLMKAIIGLVPALAGSVRLKEEEITRLPPDQRAARGIGYVPQGREVFPELTVEENLLMGETINRKKPGPRYDLVYSYFPRLKERRGALAGYISGGEQQMCAIGRALMSRPKMILLDEPSMGLAPQLVEEIFKIVGDLNAKEGVSFLLAEQNTRMALKYARYGYVLENGRVVLDGDAKTLGENEDVKEFYLGIAEGRRKSFREGKHYRRRKRWLA